MIELITDKRAYEDCEALINKLVASELWVEKNARMVGVSGERSNNERFWMFRILTINEVLYLNVSRDNANELPFAWCSDKETNKKVRRHVDPVTGRWVEDYTENAK